MRYRYRGQPSICGMIEMCRACWRRSLVLVTLAVAALAVSWLPSTAWAEAAVLDVRIMQDGNVTRVEIDLSRKVSYRRLVLDQPPRLAIDLPDVAWLVPESSSRRRIGLVNGFRFGRPRPGVARLVIDVSQSFAIRRLVEVPANDASGHRILIDLIDAKAMPRPPQRAVSPPPQPPPESPPTETVRHQLPRKKPLYSYRKRLVVIDPGHGGVDPGATGARGTYEKNVVMAIALELRRQLRATGRYEVVMTRERDEFVGLRDRLEVARDSEGELFVSLHADSLSNSRQVRGAAVYTLSERASNDEAARLAANENRADILGGVDLSAHEEIVTQILIDLAQRDANNKSIRMAEIMVEELGAVTRMLRQRRQQAGFVVLKSPDMPSVLVELGYLSNPEDERRLSDARHLAELAQAVVRAIDRFFTPEQPT